MRLSKIRAVSFPGSQPRSKDASARTCFLRACISLAAFAALTNSYSPANASPLNGAAEILITSGWTSEAVDGYADPYIQIAEVIATQTGTGNDVALASAGATASAFESYSYCAGTCDAGRAIDGVFPSAYPDIYHSESVVGHPGQYLQIDLAGSFDLSSLTIYGRSHSDYWDGANDYSFRDTYNVQIFDADGGLLYTGVLDGTQAHGSATTVVFDVESTPLPAALPLFVSGLGALGLLGWGRKKKVVALAAR